MEKRYSVWCSYENNWTCKEYSTIWMTYTCGPESIRKRVRIMHSCFNGLLVSSRDVWGFLRERVGQRLDERPMTMKELQHLIKETNHFNSESWDEDMSRYVWKWEYMGGDYNTLKEKYNSFWGADKNIITTKPIEKGTFMAVSADYEQDIFYDENNSCFDLKTEQYLTSGVSKEKVLGLYCVTYERTIKRVWGEVETVILKDTHFLAVKGSDVVGAWQKVNDGVWTFERIENGKIAGVYREEVENDKKVCRRRIKQYSLYERSLFDEYGEKIDC